MSRPGPVAHNSFYHSAQFPHRVIPEIGAFEFSRKTEPVTAISDKSFPICADYPQQRSGLPHQRRRALAAFPTPDEADPMLDEAERKLRVSRLSNSKVKRPP